MAQSELAARLLAGDRRALARAITLVQDDDPAGWELVREIYPQTGAAAVVGFTGPPGAGKSTLIGALTRRRRALGRRIGVLSIDPSSPFTGGAVLGDRIRLAEHFLDSGVFIRSMATRGALGGLAEAALQTTLLIEAAGYEEIYVETVGVGQAEVDIAAHADAVVLVLVPGSGDSVQALKAGVMEIPDVLVVNKADQPASDLLVRELRGSLPPAPVDGWQVPIVTTDALSGAGVEELEGALDAHRLALAAAGTLATRRRRNLRNEVIELASARMRRDLQARLHGDESFEALLDEVVARRLDPASAAQRLSDPPGA
jgi:LAO/AO transport system kinase